LAGMTEKLSRNLSQGIFGQTFYPGITGTENKNIPSQTGVLCLVLLLLLLLLLLLQQTIFRIHVDF
jgi:hypothetical protein